MLHTSHNTDIPYLSESFGPDTRLIPIRGEDEALAVEIFRRVYEAEGGSLDREQAALVRAVLERICFHPYATDLLARRLGKTYARCGGRGLTRGLSQMLKEADKRWGPPVPVSSMKDALPGQSGQRGDIHVLLKRLFADLLSDVSREGSREDSYALEAQIFYFLCLSKAPVDEPLLLRSLGDDPAAGRFQAAVALDRLTERNWVQRVRGEVADEVLLHPLVAEVVQSQLAFKGDPLAWLRFSAN